MIATSFNGLQMAITGYFVIVISLVVTGPKVILKSTLTLFIKQHHKN